MTPTPQAVLGDLMTYQRRLGVPFAEAWPTAVELALQDLGESSRLSWLEVLQSTRNGWQRAYDLDGVRLDLSPVDYHRDEPRHTVVS